MMKLVMFIVFVAAIVTSVLVFTASIVTARENAPQAPSTPIVREPAPQAPASPTTNTTTTSVVTTTLPMYIIDLTPTTTRPCGS